MKKQRMIPATKAFEQLGKGFSKLIHGTTYRDSSTVVLIPTRGVIHHRVVSALLGLMGPPNGNRTIQMCTGDEVGHAYNTMVKNVLAHPELRKWKYILTVEDDNIPPPDAHVKLLESINDHRLDAVSGIYFTKGECNLPQAWGDPRRPGDFTPCDVSGPIANGEVLRVNGIGMGCALWRMDLFREIEAPWYVTCADVVPEGGARMMTQDLYFCRRATAAGYAFGVDCRVKVGHLDVATGEVY